MWAVVIKHGKNPAIMPVDGKAFMDACLKAGFIPMSIENEHILAVDTLRRTAGEPPHNDPFDRILIAQAKAESMTLITHDSLLSGYAEACVMLI